MRFEKYLPVLFVLYLVAAVSSQSILDFVTVLIIILTLMAIYQFNSKTILSKSKSTFSKLDNLKLVFQELFGSKNKIGIEWAFAGYICIVILGFMFNASKDAEWLIAARKFNWFVLIYILIQAFKTIHVSLVEALKYLCLFSFPSTLYSLISYLLGSDLLTGRDNSRITGLVNSATYHAHGNAFLFVIMLAGIYFYFNELNRFWKLCVLISTSCLGLSILLTFTRGIWLSLIVSSMVILFYINWKHALKVALISSVSFFILFTGWSKFANRIEQSKSANTDMARMNLLKVNVQIWKEYPLLGIGYGENLRRNREYWDRPEWNLPKDYITSHAHNQYLNVASTTGVFGLFFFCSFFFYFILKNIKMVIATKKSKTLSPHKFSILIACLWIQIEFFIACLTDVGFEYAKIRALIILTWALLVAIEQKPEIILEKV